MKLLISIGLALVVFALIWLWVIFPSMAKMPADYEQEYAFEGSVQVFVPERGVLVPIQTTMERNLTATSITEDDVLLLQQEIIFYAVTSGGEVPLGAVNPALAALNTTETYYLDRTTRANVPGEGDVSRSGQFAFPANVEKKTYQYWSSSVKTTLPANFISEETYEGITVYVFEINSTGNAYTPDATTGLPRTMDAYSKIKVEPVSGVPVFATTKTTVKLQHPVAGLMPVLINESSYTSQTIDELVDLAESSRSLILWASVYGFWAVIGLGGVLTLVGVVRAIRAS